MRFSRARDVLRSGLLYLLIVGVSLGALDLILQVLGLFPPRPNPGDPVLGWRPARSTGAMAIGKCTEFSTGDVVTYQRNEDGIRTTISRVDTARSPGIRIAVTGDSHTDLCALNEEIHAGVLERVLREQSIDATVLNYGAGRFSPLQEALAFEHVLLPYNPDAFVMNLYTGNDLYDILRQDDRPHLVADGDDYRTAPPVWYTLDDPASPPRSPILGLLRAIGERTGVRPLLQRLRYLHGASRQFDVGVSDRIAYLRDLTRARDAGIGYSDALTAQMLNQQIFFHRFAGSREESLRRVRSLMRRLRREYPQVVLVMSPIPSYQLVGEKPVDPVLTRTMARMPFSLEQSIAVEEGLYEALRAAAVAEGWLFVDNLAVLRAIRGGSRLYNDFDYHLTPRASEHIGAAQAEVMSPSIRAAIESSRTR